ncbi:MAG: hypothetical protein JF588_05530 [Caulobacterales bacterium]|nr:hypothetical protein [Caulobacterales bacterium]
MIRSIALAGVLALAAGLGTARAADEEIQVYMDEMSKRGEIGLDVHLNYTPDGRLVPDYPGQQASDRRWRITPEWAYGLTDDIELGAYLPLATIDRSGNVEIGGVKGRIKYIAPKRSADQPWFWGLNFELGRVRHSLDINPWNAELKGIFGVRQGPWTLATNLNVDFVVSGPDHSPTSFQLATKVAYQLDAATSVGLESYNAFADTKRFGRLNDRDQQIFAVIDRSFGRWDLDFGVGYGYGAPEDRWVIKAIVGVPIGP